MDSGANDSGANSLAREGRSPCRQADVEPEQQDPQPGSSGADVRHLLHELQTRQAQLLMENEELAEACVHAEALLVQYTGLWELAREVLGYLNRPESTTGVVRDLLRLIQMGTGLEAVGIRLRHGEDFPYFETSGFPARFVQLESSLCERDETGRLRRDEVGAPALECMCGSILRGRTDPALPFFTEGGSFWTNCSTDLLASTSEQDRQVRTRNRCHREGYESVALIPLRAGDEVIGLLQLNDHRRDRFTSDMIGCLEGLGAAIGIALKRQQMDHDLVVTVALQRIRGEILQMESDADWDRVVKSVECELRQLVSCEHCVITIGDDDPVSNMEPNASWRGVELGFGRGSAPIRATGRVKYRPNRSHPLFPAGMLPEVNSVADAFFSGGTVTIDSTAEDAFSAEDLRILEQLAEVLSEGHRRLIDLQVLRASEHQFRALIENSFDAISLLDAEGRVVYNSPGCRRMLGYPEGNRIGQQTFDQVHPSERRSLLHLFGEVLRRPGHTLLPPTRVRHADGTWRWVEGVASNLLDDPSVAAIVVNYRDITERRQADDEIRVDLALERVRSETLQMDNEVDWERVLLVFRNELSGLVTCDGCSVSLVDLEANRFSSWAASTLHNPRGVWFDCVPDSLRQAMVSGAPICRRNRAELARWRDNVGPEVQSVVDVPFLGGTVAVNSIQEDAFDEESIVILQRFAQVLSEAYRRWQDLQAVTKAKQEAQEAAWRSLRREEAMGRIRDQILGMRGLADFRRELDDQWMSQLRDLGIPVHAVTLVFPSVRQGYYVFDTSLVSRDIWTTEDLPLAACPWVKEAWETGRPVVVDRQRLNAHGYTYPIEALVEVPLPFEGSLGVSSMRGDAFDEEAVLTLQVFAGLLGTAWQRLRDLSERERAQTELAEREARYRNLFTAVGQGFALHQVVVDKAGRPIDYVTLEANPAFEEIIGVRVQDLVGRSVSQFLPPDELTRWLGIFGPVALGIDESVHCETSFPANAKHFTIHAYSPSAGQLATLVTDITARKEMEARKDREAAVQEAEDAVRLRVALMNRPEDLFEVVPAISAQLRRLGMDHEALSINVVNAEGTDFVSLATDGARPAQWNELTRQIQVRSTPYPELFPWVLEAWKSQSPIYQHRCEVDAGGLLGRSVVDVPFSQGTLGVNRRQPDAFYPEEIALLQRFAGIITEAHQRFVDLGTHQRLQQETVRLERLRAIGELSAGVSHNLNNLLTGIVLPAQILQQIDLNADARVLVDGIAVAGERAADLVRQLHHSVRGAVTDALEPVDAKGL